MFHQLLKAPEPNLKTVLLISSTVEVSILLIHQYKSILKGDYEFCNYALSKAPDCSMLNSISSRKSRPLPAPLGFKFLRQAAMEESRLRHHTRVNASERAVFSSCTIIDQLRRGLVYRQPTGRYIGLYQNSWSG